MKIKDKIIYALLFLLFVGWLFGGIAQYLASSESSSTYNVPFKISSDVESIEKVTDIDGKTFYFLFKEEYIGDYMKYTSGFAVEVRLKEVDGTEKIWYGIRYPSEFGSTYLKFTDTQRPPIMFKGGMFRREILYLYNDGTLSTGSGPDWKLRAERIYRRDSYYFRGSNGKIYKI